MKKIYITGIFVMLLSVVLVFAISDNAAVDDSAFNLCEDSDEGVYSAIAGTLTYQGWIGGENTKEDTCSANGKRVVEWYCNARGKKARKTITCASGECIDGACVAVEPSCGAIKDNKGNAIGARDETGKGHLSRCKGNELTTYFCDGDTVSSTVVTCPSRCAGRNCVGNCIDRNSDITDGVVELDGKEMKNKCVNTRRLRVYSCAESGLKTGVVVASAAQTCVTENGIGKLVTSATVGDVTTVTGSLQEQIDALSNLISSLQTTIDDLTSRIAVLETPATTA